MFHIQQGLVLRQQETRLLQSSTVASTPRVAGRLAIPTALRPAAGQIIIRLKALAGLSTHLPAAEVLLVQTATEAVVYSAAAVVEVAPGASLAAIRLEASPAAIPLEAFLVVIPLEAFLVAVSLVVMEGVAVMAEVAEAVDQSW
jgi:hypothetical protein